MIFSITLDKNIFAFRPLFLISPRNDVQIA